MSARVTDQGWTERAGLDGHLRGEPEAFHAGVKLRPGDPEERRGLRLVAFGVFRGGDGIGQLDIQRGKPAGEAVPKAEPPTCSPNRSGTMCHDLLHPGSNVHAVASTLRVGCSSG